MKNLKIYNLLINHQKDLLKLLRKLGVSDAKNRIKYLLDEQLFEVIECTDREVISIKKKSTGEVFKKGCKFYVKKYNEWRVLGYFDYTLFGNYIDETFYKNYVRADYGGLYHLNDISLVNENK